MGRPRSLLPVTGRHQELSAPSQAARFELPTWAFGLGGSLCAGMAYGFSFLALVLPFWSEVRIRDEWYKDTMWLGLWGSIDKSHFLWKIVPENSRFCSSWNQYRVASWGINGDCKSFHATEGAYHMCVVNDLLCGPFIKINLAMQIIATLAGGIAVMFCLAVVWKWFATPQRNSGAAAGFLVLSGAAGMASTIMWSVVSYRFSKAYPQMCKSPGEPCNILSVSYYLAHVGWILSILAGLLTLIYARKVTTYEEQQRIHTQRKAKLEVIAFEDLAPTPKSRPTPVESPRAKVEKLRQMMSPSTQYSPSSSPSNTNSPSKERESVSPASPSKDKEDGEAKIEETPKGRISTLSTDSSSSLHAV